MRNFCVAALMIGLMNSAVVAQEMASEPVILGTEQAIDPLDESSINETDPVTCQTLIVALQQYSGHFQQSRVRNEDFLHRYAELLTGWYKAFSRYEGKVITFSEEAFAGIKKTSENLLASSDTLVDTKDLLAEQMAEVIKTDCYSPVPTVPTTGLPLYDGFDAHNLTARDNEYWLAEYLYESSVQMESIYQQLEPFQGQTLQIPVGTFSALKDMATEVTEVEGLIKDNYKVLSTGLLELIQVATDHMDLFLEMNKMR